MDALRLYHAPAVLAPVVTEGVGPGRTRATGVPGLVVGVSGSSQNAAVAVAAGGHLVACCEQERITRVRAEALRPGTVPVEALRALLETLGRQPGEVGAFVTAERDAVLPSSLPRVAVDHHFAHAATAALTSPFSTAAVLVCDQHGEPPVSVWRFDGGRLANVGWPWEGEGLAAIYSECAELLGLGPRAEHKLEALARLAEETGADVTNEPLSYTRGRLSIGPRWRETVSEWLSKGRGITAAAFAACRFQRSVGDALVALLHDIRERLPYDNLCVGGGLFYNTYLNTRLVESGLFSRVFVPLNPGNAGLAVGAALAHSQAEELRSVAVSPFLGPEYTMEAIKATLDNCKLSYAYVSEDEVIDTVVRALARGLLVGWFQGRMEWGHRSLGHRSILANPFSPHVLENLNGYLKQREPYRAYGLSVCEEAAPRHFDVYGPSGFMEFEYKLLEPEMFRHILPAGVKTLRVQTLPQEAGLFRKLHRALGAAGHPGVLVNTSFNGFHEPIVCTPRDAVRVFYGSGLDVLVLGQFIIRK